MLDRFDEVVQTVVSLLLQQVLSVPDELIASVDQRLCKGLVVISCKLIRFILIFLLNEFESKSYHQEQPRQTTPKLKSPKLISFCDQNFTICTK